MTKISFDVDEKVISDAQKVLDEIGLSMSSALTMFLKSVAREHRIPFELTADPFYSKENMMLLEKRVSNNESDKSVLKEHSLIYTD